MWNERRRERNCYLVAAGIAIFLAPPLINISKAPYLRAAILTGKADCSSGVESFDPRYPFDAIVVPGAGVIKTAYGSYLPNTEQNERLKAASKAFSQGLAPNVILLSTTLNPGENKPIEVSSLQNAHNELHGGLGAIPEEKILTVDHSINTATEMANLAKLASKHNIGKVVVVTNAYHILRATLFACLNGLTASSLPAEEILAENHHRRNIKTYLKEKMEVICLLWDPWGKIPTYMRRVWGN